MVSSINSSLHVVAHNALTLEIMTRESGSYCRYLPIRLLDALGLFQFCIW